MTFVPSPSWPTLFSPQHLTDPAVVSAQVWAKPVVIWTTPLLSPETFTGVEDAIGRLPSPSWPAPLMPQHFTAPAIVSAQVWLLAALIWTTPLPSPTTSTGVRRFVVVPSPSLPTLLLPQHLAAPVTTAQVWREPVVTSVAPLVNPETFTGVERSVVVPSPSAPAKL